MRLRWSLALLLLLWVPTVSAHPQFALSTINRYGRLVLMPGKLLLDYSLMVGEVPASQLLTRADTSGDGQLSQPELDALYAELRRAVEKDLTIQIDGQPLTLHLRQTQQPPSRPVAPATSFAVELSAEATWPDPGEAHQLRYEDRADLPPVGEVELRIEDSPETMLLETRSGNPTTAPDPKQAPTDNVPTLFRQFGPPRSLVSDRSVTVRFAQRPSPTPQPTLPWRALLALATLALLVAIPLVTRRLLRN
ncbi:MAG: hypothetical protein U0745_02425 [Polyangia bacterium]|jgi:hypothetical protein